MYYYLVSVQVLQQCNVALPWILAGEGVGNGSSSRLRHWQWKSSLSLAAQGKWTELKTPAGCAAPDTVMAYGIGGSGSVNPGGDQGPGKSEPRPCT